MMQRALRPASGVDRIMHPAPQLNRFRRRTVLSFQDTARPLVGIRLENSDKWSTQFDIRNVRYISFPFYPNRNPLIL